MKNLQQIVNEHRNDFETWKAGLPLIKLPHFYEALYEYYLVNGMPYGVAKARTGDPDSWIEDRLEREDLA